MSPLSLAVAALFAQAAVAVPADARPASADAAVYTDVAFTDLAAGRAQTALAKLESSGAARSDDPATLINLGSAYAAVGQNGRAMTSYQAAINSSQRYDLQMADGSWVDSREAARMAIRRLLATTAQASR
ncbi:hypothetical protein [Novosphingobium colocasiae]|uniref:hypothetical protein n=1 Tax=Novosphingobium colocasiae TaxID=1256513 RepID=UPI0035AF1B3E